MNYTAIIPAAGIGKRMGLGFNKIRYELNGKSIIKRTVEIFENDRDCSAIIIATGKEEIHLLEEDLKDLNKIEKIVVGGKERQDSIYNALVHAKTDYVFVHDAARPFLDDDTLTRLKTAVVKKDAVICGVQTKNTLKKVVDGKVVDTIDRDTTVEVHTPQAFCYNLLMDAYHYARDRHLQVTDDAMMVEAFGHDVFVVDSTYNNIKITTTEDLIQSEAILRSRDE
ncbi:MAG TPA: 2-C-methyl-D-erythritol 4-phosphate cytidylyltransferase [Candidatus Nosocomiicoccus stercorigallinarum]|nr:2-C-methyl-D-erythritol 4-phosphate cytidylyltransferase [Candidatus Nosocomiicoccus stercorigallinarum]